MPVAGDERACGLVARALEGEDQARSNFGASTSSGIRGFRIAPHDQGVFAIVGVIAAADPARAEAETLVQLDRALVRDSHLQRVAALARVFRQLEKLVEQRRRNASPAKSRSDG